MLCTHLIHEAMRDKKIKICVERGHGRQDHKRELHEEIGDDVEKEGLVAEGPSPPRP